MWSAGESTSTTTTCLAFAYELKLRRVQFTSYVPFIVTVLIFTGVPSPGQLQPAPAGPGGRSPGGQEQGVCLHSPSSDCSGRLLPRVLYFNPGSKSVPEKREIVLNTSTVF